MITEEPMENKKAAPAGNDGETRNDGGESRRPNNRRGGNRRGRGGSRGHQPRPPRTDEIEIPEKIGTEAAPQRLPRERGGAPRQRNQRPRPASRPQTDQNPPEKSEVPARAAQKSAAPKSDAPKSAPQKRGRDARDSRPSRDPQAESLRRSLDDIFRTPERTAETDPVKNDSSYEALVASMPPDPTLDAVFADPVEPQAPDPGTTTEIVGVRFTGNNKTYYFAPGDISFRVGDHAIVETAQGLEFGEIAVANRRVPNSRIVQPLRQVIRMATPADIAHNEENHRREEDAFKICIEKIAMHKLAMKLVSAKYTFDNNKLIFYFTTTVGRVDFRELVKTLAGIFHTRIELRQINMRDEAKTIGGFGVCGRRLCCSTFLSSLSGVSLRMAKEQGISLNSAKISGYCGRLICCLRYEQDTYAREYAILPPVDSVVTTPDGRGVITDVNPIGYLFKVKLDDKPDQPAKLYRLADLEVVTRGRDRAPAQDAADAPEDEEN